MGIDATAPFAATEPLKVTTTAARSVPREGMPKIAKISNDLSSLYLPDVKPEGRLSELMKTHSNPPAPSKPSVHFVLEYLNQQGDLETSYFGFTCLGFSRFDRGTSPETSATPSHRFFSIGIGGCVNGGR